MCPPTVRKAVLELQRQQAHKEHLNSGRPRYGSRKIFFQRMWARLHGPSADGESAVVVESDVSPETARAEAEQAEALRNGKSVGTNPLMTPPLGGASSKEDPSRDVVRSPPSEVSNNNTDNDDNENDNDNEPDEKDEDSTVVNIQLTLNAHNHAGGIDGSKKRKLDTSTSASSGTSGQDEENDGTKKHRISSVETVEV